MTLDGHYGGITPVTKAIELTILQLHLCAIKRDGYFYTYVTNQSEKKVYFNNLTLVHKRGNIVQSNDYYPLVPMGFGLTWENPKDDLHTYHASLREGKELQRNEWSSGGLDMLDFSQRDHYVAARMYNPLIGRWHNPDPLNQFDSPYNAMANNPVINIDPDGMWSLPLGGIMGSVGSIISNMTTTHIVSPRDMSISTEYTFGHGFGEALQVAGAGLAFWEGGKMLSDGLFKSGQRASDKYEDAILAGRLVYTKNYGWVDKTHAFTMSAREHVGAENLWKQIVNESGEKKNGYFEVIYKQDARVFGLNPGVTKKYWVKEGLSYADQISIAVSIFKEVSWAFESLQSLALWSGSSFEPADLPSNMLGLYRAIFPTMTQDYIMQLVEPLSAEESVEVYRQYPGTFTSAEYKNYSFQPKFFANKFSPDNPAIPLPLIRFFSVNGVSPDKLIRK